MADIDLVIKIPEEEYKCIMDGKWEGNALADYIENGTPLSKEPVLDKIRAEITEDIEMYRDLYDDICHGLCMALDIIDKYKVASENKKLITKNLENDVVSRADVLEIMRYNWNIHDGDVAMQESIDAIKIMPSIILQEEKR